MKRSFLFLQGPNSPFFAILGEELLDNGHRVLRLNFNSGDSFFWHGENTAEYKHNLSEFKTYLNNVARLRKITDLVIYDDSNPINKQAIEALKHLKIRLHVFSDGIFSDNWITLEERIFGTKAVFPKDPKFYLRNVEGNLPREKKFANNSRAKALFALQYRLSRLFVKPGNAVSQAKLIIYMKTRQFLIKLRQDKNKVRLNRRKYFLIDYELAKKASLMRSFAAKANPDDHLVYFSKKPISAIQLAKTNDAAAKHKLAGRVIVVENANFKQLVRNAKAYVTNNSIDGLLALRYGKPVMALSTSAIYNINGLTEQGQLNDFWNGYRAPDGEIFRKFRNYVIGKSQISGSFYHKKGMKLALATSMRRILGPEYESQRAGIFGAS